MRTLLNTVLLSLVIILAACNNITNNEIMTTNLNTVYSVVWSYKIKPENKEKFEIEYGSSGTWSKLFYESENYRGSFLLKSEDESDTYLLVDTWIDKESYENFKKINQETYNNISSGFEYLYLTEKKIGSFNSVQ
ncbi:MAG: hypothetical protein R2819_12510 [Allomuricauda sp.]